MCLVIDLKIKDKVSGLGESGVGREGSDNAAPASKRGGLEKMKVWASTTVNVKR